jgi:hypothetical protein
MYGTLMYLIYCSTYFEHGDYVYLYTTFLLVFSLSTLFSHFSHIIYGYISFIENRYIVATNKSPSFTITHVLLSGREEKEANRRGIGGRGREEEDEAEEETYIGEDSTGCHCQSILISLIN